MICCVNNYIYYNIVKPQWKNVRRALCVLSVNRGLSFLLCFRRLWLVGRYLVFFSHIIRHTYLCGIHLILKIIQFWSFKITCAFKVKLYNIYKNIILSSIIFIIVFPSSSDNYRSRYVRKYQILRNNSQPTIQTILLV